MPIKTFKVIKANQKRPHDVEVKFEPYKNSIAYVDTDIQGWGKTDNVSLQIDLNHPVVIEETRSTLIKKPDRKSKPQASIDRTITGLEDKPHLITLSVRMDSATSVQMLVNGDVIDYVDDSYTHRIGGLATPVNGELKIELRFNDIRAQFVAWVGGFFLTEVHEDFMSETAEELMEIYPYIKVEKTYPTMADILARDEDRSIYRWYLSDSGRKIPSYFEPLTSYGVDENTVLEKKEESLKTSIFNAMVNDATLMSMVEGNRTHVSPAFPKEDGNMSTLGQSHFPRIQYFTGFAVNERIADARPIVDEVNYAINVYIPVQKVLDSVDAIMMTEQSASIMADLGWTKVRGSDYFLKQEQLYVVQTQYIKQVPIPKTRK